VARSFRLYEKKRGNRRTGSKRFGSLGEALFFAVFFFLGCAGLVFLLATEAIPEWRVNHAFIKTTATVVGKQGATKVLIRYYVGGERRQALVAIPGSSTADEPPNPDAPARFAVDQECVCWYDPANPKVAVLSQGYTWWVWLPLSVPISFLLIGGGGLIYTVLSLGKSTERRAASVTRSGPSGRPRKTGSPQPAFPNVPSADQISDSPGTELAYRLPMAGSPAWTLGLWLAACLLWNGIVSGFAVVAVHGLWEGAPDWVLIGFLIPFLVVGIGLIVVFVRQWVLATAIGPTLLEISDQPLHPGRSCELLLWQSGRLRLCWLEVLLACDEEATYRHGTNTRNESHRVFEQSVFRRDHPAGHHPEDGARFEVQREPLTARFAAEVPAGAMHSFKSEHNEINWRFIVRGKAAGWPDFERSFPVIVCPHGYEMSKS
jgi:hypothetical protein